MSNDSYEIVLTAKKVRQRKKRVRIAKLVLLILAVLLVALYAVLKFINSNENSTFKKTEYVGIYFGIVGLIQNFVAFVFVKFFGYVCISDFFKEFNQLVKFFLRLNNGVVLSRNNKYRQTFIMRIPVLFVKRFLLQFKKVDKTVCCKNKAALFIVVIFFDILFIV